MESAPQRRWNSKPGRSERVIGATEASLTKMDLPEEFRPVMTQRTFMGAPSLEEAEGLYDF